MENKPKRPPSVWIAQIFLIALGLFLLVTSVIGVIVITYLLGMDSAQFLVLLLLNPAIGLLCLVSFWGLAKRKPYGRWLGTSVLVPSFGFIMLVVPIAMPTVIFLLVLGLFLFLIYRLAFGPASNAFFAKPDTTE